MQGFDRNPRRLSESSSARVSAAMAPVSKIPGPSATRRPSKDPQMDEPAAGSARPRRRTLSNPPESWTARPQFEDQSVFSPHLSPSHDGQPSFFPPTAANQAPIYPAVSITKPSFGKSAKSIPRRVPGLDTLFSFAFSCIL